MDYYERALYNHILPSKAPGGGFVYYTPMRPGHYRVFSRDYDAFWCCVGTGMENHGEYGGMIYAAAPHRLYVNLFIPSVLTDRAHGLTLTQATRFPEEPRTRLALTLTKPRRMTLSLRCPAWVAPGALTVRVNGRAVPIAARPGSFADVSRLWKTGDRVEMALPMRLTTEPLPDSRQYAAFFYGLVLPAGRLGTEGLTLADFHGGGPIDVPVEVSGQTAAKKIPESHVPVFLGTAVGALPKIVRVAGQPLTFRTRGLARPHDVTLVPFYRLFFERYALYWNVLTPDSYARRQASAVAEQRDADTLEARTLDRVLVGDPISEAAHALSSDRSQTGSASAPFAHWRDAKGGFGYALKVPADRPAALRCVYWGSDVGRTFDILVDGTKIATQALTASRPGEYLSVTYPIPDSLTRGRAMVTVRFQPAPGQTAGGVYDVRVVRL